MSDIDITGECPTVDNSNEAGVVEDGDVYRCSECNFSLGPSEEVARKSAANHFVN